MARSRRSRAAGVDHCGHGRHRPGRRRRDGLQPLDHRGADGIGRQHLGVVQQVEHPEDQRLLVGDRQAHHHGAVVPVVDHRVLAQLGGHPARLGPVDQHVDLDRLAVAELPRVAGEGQVDVEAGRDLGRPRLVELGQAGDPVDPEGPGLAPVAVEADHVPATVAEAESGHVDVASLPPVVESHRRPLADGVEHERQGGQPVDRRAGPPTGRRPDGGATPRPRPASTGHRGR